MPKLTADQKRQIQHLPPEVKDKIILKWAGRDRLFFEFLYITYMNPDFGAEDLLEIYKEELRSLQSKVFPGRSEAMRRMRLLRTSLKLITQFKKTVKQPHLEVELYLHVLDFHFEKAEHYLGSGYYVYDNNIAKTVGKVIHMIQDKLHEDYLLEYKEKVNNYLTSLRRFSTFNTKVRELPISLD